MPLLGSAAMLLSFDVVAEDIEEHDRWHTHEHLPERLSIPGFVRGTRWIALEGTPRYMVVYEVADLAVLESEPYLARLNSPSPWTSRIMPSYRGMNRGFCAVLGSFGVGLGYAAALVRFTEPQEDPERLHQGLLHEALPGLPGMTGLGGAHLLRGAQTPSMTKEQSIRGADRGVDSALIVMGYDADAVTAAARMLREGLSAHGASGVGTATYRLDYALTSSEVR